GSLNSAPPATRVRLLSSGRAGRPPAVFQRWRGVGMLDTRPAAAPGMFSPGGPAELAANVRPCLVEAATRPRAAGARPKALIVPHAGYIYSGPIAAAAYARLPAAHATIPRGGILRPPGSFCPGPIPAAAYARLAAAHATIRRVVILGPTHRVAIRGLAVPSVRAFMTPLGEVESDRN